MIRSARGLKKKEDNRERKKIKETTDRILPGWDETCASINQKEGREREKSADAVAASLFLSFSLSIAPARENGRRINCAQV